MKSTYKAVEQELAQFAIDAHGGLERWKRFTTLSVHGINGGVLWGAKGKAGVIGVEPHAVIVILGSGFRRVNLTVTLGEVTEPGIRGRLFSGDECFF